MKWITKIFFTPLNSIYIVMFLRTLALILVVCLMYLIIMSWKDNISLNWSIGNFNFSTFSFIYSYDEY